MGSRVLWAIVGGFLLGVFVRSFFLFGLSFAGSAALIGVALFALAYVEASAGGQSAIIAAVFCLAFAGGIARMDFATLSADPILSANLNKSVTLEGVVTAEPDRRDTSTLITLRASKLVGTDTSQEISVGVRALAPAHTNLSYGDVVQIRGTLRVPQAFDTGAGRQFNYPYYLAKDGIEYELAFARPDLPNGNFGNPIVALAISAKEFYLQGEDAALPEPEAGLAGGITVGDKRSIGPELSAEFQRVSLIHMVVLSGYNITVVMDFVRWLVQLLPRFAQYGSLGAVVIFFILMSGGASSAVRAGAMALIAVFARATNRVFLAGRILGVVCLAMVLYNPFTLCFDPSFQLSVLATLGLVLFSPLYAAWLVWISKRFGLLEIISSTLGTQTAVLPLLLYQNGNLSIVGLPANILALMPVPLAMFFSIIAAIGGMIFGPYAAPLAYPAYVLLWYIIHVAHFFAALPFAAVAIPAFSAWWMFAAYALMFGGLFVYKRKRPRESVTV